MKNIPYQKSNKNLVNISNIDHFNEFVFTFNSLFNELWLVHELYNYIYYTINLNDINDVNFAISYIANEISNNKLIFTKKGSKKRLSIEIIKDIKEYTICFSLRKFISEYDGSSYIIIYNNFSALIIYPDARIQSNDFCKIQYKIFNMESELSIIFDTK